MPSTRRRPGPIVSLAFFGALCVLGASAMPATGQTTPASVADDTSTSAPAVKVPENPAVTARAKAEFLAWQAGKVDRAHYSTQAAKAFTDDKVAEIAPELEGLGKIQSFAYGATAKAMSDTVYGYTVTCEHGTVRMTFVLDANDKIDGLYFRPV